MTLEEPIVMQWTRRGVGPHTAWPLHRAGVSPRDARLMSDTELLRLPGIGLRSLMYIKQAISSSEPADQWARLLYEAPIDAILAELRRRIAP